MAILPNLVNWYIFLYPKPKTCMESSKADGANEFGWGVLFDQANTSLEWRVGYFEYRQFGRRHQTPDGRSTDRVVNLTGTPAQPVPGQSYNRSPAFTRKYGQAPQAHAEYAPQNVEPVTIRSGKYTRAISLSMVLFQDVQDVSLFCPTRHLNPTQ